MTQWPRSQANFWFESKFLDFFAHILSIWANFYKKLDIWSFLALTPYMVFSSLTPGFFALIQEQLNPTLACFNAIQVAMSSIVLPVFRNKAWFIDLCTFFCQLYVDFTRNLRANFSHFSKGHKQAKHFTQVWLGDMKIFITIVILWYP